MPPLDASAELRQELRNRQFYAAMQVVPFTSSMNIVIAIVGTWWYRDLAPWAPKVLWVVALVGAESGSFHSFRLSQVPHYIVQPGDIRRFGWQSGITATTYALALAWIFSRIDTDNRVLISGLAIGLIGVGAFVTACIPRIALRWIAFLGVGTCIALLREAGPIYSIMLVLVAIYLLLMAITTLATSRLFIAHVQAEMRAKKHNQELEAFVYTIAHDLRAPMRHILGFSELLKERAQATLDGESRRLLDVIVRSTTRQGKQVDELLKYATVGQQAVQLQPLDAGALIEEVRLQLLAEDESLTQVEWVIGNIPAIWGDAVLLRQALINLLQNAIKFSRAATPPKIEIFSLQPETGLVIISIRDNGVGFDMHHGDKLFKMFQRLHAEHEFPGTGIGLAIVRRAIERQNGTVWAESSPGDGATFSFSLRRADTQ